MLLKRSIISVFLGLAIVAVGQVADSVAQDAGTDSMAAVKRIEQIWTTQRDSLGSAEFQGQVYRGGSRLLTLQPDEVVVRFGQIIREPTEGLLALRDVYCARVDGFRPHWGNKFEVYFRNGKYRERMSAPENQNEWDIDRLYNGERSSDFRMSTMQYDVFPGRSTIATLGPDELRVMPLEMLKHVQSAKLEGDNLILQSPIWTMTIDRQNGFVHEIRVVEPQGRPICVMLQDGPITSDDGQVFPTWRMVGVYDNERRLIALDLTHLQSIKTNTEIPESEFQMTTVAGAKFVDYRDLRDDRFHAVSTGAGGQDIFELVDFKSMDRELIQSGGWGVWVVEILVFLGILFLVIWMVRRKPVAP